ncbi:MAG: acyl-CoA dehydrogenase [Halomonadaceae bacterium]|nr:MAG: acyl-CoA dehydrogenase [Halomonadaceae bacterium]
MRRDPMGIALSTVNRLAGSSWLDRLKLRKPTEYIVYTGTKAGFQAINTTQKEWRRFRGAMASGSDPDTAPRALFDLSLTEDQQMITETVRQIAEEVIRPAADAADEAMAVPKEVHDAIHELGLTLQAVPAEYGGVAEKPDPVTSVLIAEQLAWGDFSIASAALSTYSVAQALARWGSDNQKQRLLPAFCQDTPLTAVFAVDEPAVLFDPMKPGTLAYRKGNQYILNGRKSAVIRAAEADLYLVLAMVQNEGPRFFLVEGGASGLYTAPDPAMGLRAAATGQLVLEDVAVHESTMLGEKTPADCSRLMDYASLMQCALAVGTCQGIQDFVIPYCNDRVAFGEPISHRQAVAFAISNMAIETDSIRLVLWRAASLAEQGLPFATQAAQARALAAQHALTIGSDGVQLLGGHGFVKEYPVERWYRDLRSIGSLTGGLHA